MRGLDKWLSKVSSRSSVTWRACHDTDGWVPPQSFRFSRSGVGSEDLHFYHVPGNCRCCRPRGLGVPQHSLVLQALGWPGCEDESVEVTRWDLSDPGHKLQGPLAKATGPRDWQERKYPAAHAQCWERSSINKLRAFWMIVRLPPSKLLSLSQGTWAHLRLDTCWLWPAALCPHPLIREAKPLDKIIHVQKIWVRTQFATDLLRGP